MAYETDAGRGGRAKMSVSGVKFDPLVDLSNEAMVDLVSNLEMVRDVFAPFGDEVVAHCRLCSRAAG